MKRVLQVINTNEFSFSLSRFAIKHYAPFITRSSVKVFGMLLLSGIVGVSLFASMKLPDGAYDCRANPQTITGKASCALREGFKCLLH